MSRNLRAENLARWLKRDINEPGLSKSTIKNIKYYGQLALATPKWADQKGIKAWYDLAQKVGKQVDHIVPINHPYVCGLHCEDNFQLLTPEQNLHKSNHNWPDSPFETYHMFDDPSQPEQYQLPL